jgi:hypothetical protein
MCKMHLGVLGIVLVPAVVQGLARADQGNRGDQPDVEAGLDQAPGERAVVVTGRLEADGDRAPQGVELCDEPIVLGPGVGHRHAPPPPGIGDLDQDLVAQLGNIDGDKGRRGRCRLVAGHGRSAPLGVARHHHCGGLLAGRGRPRQGQTPAGSGFPMCYGGEFTAKVVRAWLGRIGVRTLFIERGSPWENGYNESFNSKLPDELLDCEIFTSLKEAEVLIERWRHHYNTARPHSALGYQPPAPEAALPSPSGLAYAQPRWAQPGTPKHEPTLS